MFVQSICDLWMGWLNVAHLHPTLTSSLPPLPKAPCGESQSAPPGQFLLEGKTMKLWTPTIFDARSPPTPVQVQTHGDKEFTAGVDSA